MQVLYAMNRDKALTVQKALNSYRKNINQSYHLYLFNLHQLIRTAEYSRTIKKKIKDKHRPTAEDLAFQPILVDNDLVQSLVENERLRREFSLHKTGAKLNDDSSRVIYRELNKTEEYQAYLKNEDRTNDDHKKILIQLFKTMVSNEVFLDVLDENYLFWDDDKSLIVGSMKKTLKALPNQGEDFFKAYQPTDETVKEFGEVLLKQVHDDGKALFEIIEPTLKNWDAERVAVLDMILLKMAVCELMNFPTIPTKVTLNEFVEISKLYSTDKSKDFINGILDRLLKKLEKEGKVVKEGRGLIQ